MKNMKKSIYLSPAAEFVAIEAKQDVLVTSAEIERDEHSGDYGVVFPF